MDKFSEYTFFAESTQFLTERRQTAIQVYLTVNAAIFGVFGIFINDTRFTGLRLIFSSLPLFVVGIFVCWTWYQTLQQWRALIRWRYTQLMAMEQSEALAESHQFYTKEWEDFYKPRQGREGISFSQLEIWLPRLFIALYVIYGISLVGAVLLGFY